MATNSSERRAAETFDYEEYQHRLDLVRVRADRPLHGSRDPQGQRVLQGLDVLDLGCGTGHLSRMLERETGCLLRSGLRRVPRSRGSGGGRGARFVVGGGEHLPFRDESFDAILLIDVLEHIADDAGVAREATRVLGRAGACSAWCRRTRRSTHAPTPPTATCGATTATSSCGSSSLRSRDALRLRLPVHAPVPQCAGARARRRRSPRSSGQVGFKRAAMLRQPRHPRRAAFRSILLFAGWFTRGVRDRRECPTGAGGPCCGWRLGSLA